MMVVAWRVQAGKTGLSHRVWDGQMADGYMRGIDQINVLMIMEVIFLPVGKRSHKYRKDSMLD